MMKMMTKYSVIALALLGVLAGSAQAQTTGSPAVTPIDYAIFDGDGPWTLGYTFTADTPLSVTALGAFDWEHDGFATSHEVGLWDENGNLLASTAVASGDTLVGDFRYKAISSVTLAAGNVYYVGASNFGTGDSYAYAGSVNTPWGVTFLSSAYIQSNGLEFPPYLSGMQPGYFGGNLLVAPVPEPETYAMLAAGLALVGLASRRKQGRRAA
jgi:hypothetical protein